MSVLVALVLVAAMIALGVGIDRRLRSLGVDLRRNPPPTRVRLLGVVPIALVFFTSQVAYRLTVDDYQAVPSTAFIIATLVFLAVFAWNSLNWYRELRPPRREGQRG